MAHNLSNIDGQDAFAAVGQRDAVWHRLGQYTGTEETIQWARMAGMAQLDWKVIKRDIYDRNPVTASVFQIPDMKAMHRMNDGQYLGCVGDGYEPIQNAEMFQYADALLSAIDGAHWSTAGALGFGAQIFGVAQLPIVSRLRNALGDETHNYLLFMGSHDMSSNNSFQLCRTRPVCQNTINIALTEANRKLAFRHTKNVKARMQNTLASVQSIQQTIKTQDELNNTLAGRRITKEHMTAVLDRLFPATMDADTGSDKKVRSTKTSNVALKVLELFESNDNNAFPEIRGTAYNLLNALTEYTDHFRTVRITEGKQGTAAATARAEGALFGTGDAFKTQAMTAVLELTADAPVHDPLNFKVPDLSGSDWAKTLGL